MIPQWASPMPHPDDRSSAQRRPTVRQEGIYFVFRAPFDTEVHIREPEGDTYALEYFEFENWLRFVMQVRGEEFRCICDRLWNFHSIAFFPGGRCVILRESPESEGWEEEITPNMLNGDLAEENMRPEEILHAEFPNAGS